MDKSKRQKIWDFAGKVRETLELPCPMSLDDLTRAIELLGGSLNPYDILESTPQPEASISRKETGFEVALDISQPATRQIFSLAHEVGHLFLHMGFGNPQKWEATKEYLESYARSGRDEEELEANEFAASLLMPEREFRELSSQLSVDDVAEHFHVSSNAALIRGRWLGIYGWTS